MAHVQLAALRRSAAIAVSSLMLHTGLAHAQTLREQVSTLLTAPAGPPGGQATDPVAAALSRDTLLTVFGIELSSAPVTSGTSGFVYEMNPALGVAQRASNGFGPFFTERALRSGEGQLSLGVVLQSASYSAVQGRDLELGDFPVTAVRTAGTPEPYAVERLRVNLSTRTVTFRTMYGATSRLDVGAAVPFVQVDIDGLRLSDTPGRPVFEVLRQGRASGIGDASVSARFRLLGTRGTGIAVGSDVRFPTGSAANLLGTGRLSTRGQVIASIEDDRVGASTNAGFARGGASDELFASGAVTVAAAPRLTLVGELLGRRLSGLHSLSQVYAPHSTLPLAESMRWVADERSAVLLGYAVIGAKWNITGSVLVSANLLVRLTEAGLRARLSPSVTVDYDFSPLNRW